MEPVIQDPTTRPHVLNSEGQTLYMFTCHIGDNLYTVLQSISTDNVYLLELLRLIFCHRSHSGYYSNPEYSLYRYTYERTKNDHKLEVKCQFVDVSSLRECRRAEFEAPNFDTG